MTIKESWEQWSGLIKWMTTIISGVGLGLIFLFRILVLDLIEEEVAAEVPTIPAVTQLSGTVQTNTNAIQNNTATVDRLADDVRALNQDVRDLMHTLATGQPPDND